MERRTFIRSCSCLAVGLPIIGMGLQGCGALHYATFTFAENQFVVPKSEFVQVKKDKERHLDVVLLKTEASSFPICLSKLENDTYSAVLMECTHQGCELKVAGSVYSCPCHGSEFSKTGTVLNGPAETDLRKFPTRTDNENIYISFT